MLGDNPRTENQYTFAVKLSISYSTTPTGTIRVLFAGHRSTALSANPASVSSPASRLLAHPALFHTLFFSPARSRKSCARPRWSPWQTWRRLCATHCRAVG